MRITLVRDDGKVNTMRTLRIEQLVEQMKVETKTQPVSKMREVLPFMLPGDKNDYVQKVPKLIPAAAFFRKGGIMTMSEYNGIVMIQVLCVEKALMVNGRNRLTRWSGVDLSAKVMPGIIPGPYSMM